MEQQSVMEVKNTPLLFQQELNTYYKDILNCEIVHPPYWDWKVPETFFLRKRKWIDLYEDWWGDEVIDYMKFDNEEYAIVKYDSRTNSPKIKIKKWLDTVDTSSLATLTNTWRLLQLSLWEFNWPGIIWTNNIIWHFVKEWWTMLFVFSYNDYTINWVTTKELFITEYKLTVPYNIDYNEKWKTYLIGEASELAHQWEINCTFSFWWKSLFIYSHATNKFYQLKLEIDFDVRSITPWIITSTYTVPASLISIKSFCVNKNADKIYYCSWTNTIWTLSFDYNNIAWWNIWHTKYFWSLWDILWIWVDWSWLKLYLTSWGRLYSLTWTTEWELDTYSLDANSKLIDSNVNGAQWIQVSSDSMHFFIMQLNEYVAQLWFEHSKTLATQSFNPNVNHSFKRDFQACKWTLSYWNCTSTKITWSVVSDEHRLTPTTAVTWTANAYAWMYVYITWWATTVSETWVWWWQVFQIKGNTDSYLIVAGWDTKPNESTYGIFTDFWEVPVFVWADWLYAIHNDTCITRFQWLNKSPVYPVDACFNNGRIFAVLNNWLVACSATTSSNWEQALYWWQYSAFFNGSSTIWNVTWAMRIIPFNDIVIVFTADSIYVIKKETTTMTNDNDVNISYDTYPINLAFDFVWLKHRKAVCAYNTWIYFVSDKNEFLSLNIEESYYNKYKITTEDLWIDIQQWLDNIEEWDDLAIAINTETIYLIWNNSEKSTIFQYDTFYSFWHRRETQLIIKNIRVDTHQTYMWPVTYRYWLTDTKLDSWAIEYTQHLRWFNWDTDIFSMKTILYHKLYMWVNTDPNTKIIYNATLSDWLYSYVLPLNQINFLQKAVWLKNDWILWHWILWFTPLGWKAEDIIRWTYLSEIDVLEAPLGFTYSLLEIIVEWDFETGGNLLWTLVHEEHLTPYEDVIPYISDY